MGPSSCTFRKKWFLQNKWNHSSTEMKKSQLRPHRKSCSRNHHTCAPPPPKSPPAQSWCTRAWAISYLDYRPSGLLTSHSHLCLFAWLMVENPHSRDELLGLYPAPLPLSFLYASSLSAPPRKQHPQGNRKRETDISEMPAMPELASSVPGGSGQIWKRRPPPWNQLCAKAGSANWPRYLMPPQKGIREITLGCAEPRKGKTFQVLKDLPRVRTDWTLPSEIRKSRVLPNPQEDCIRLFPSKSRDVKFNLKHVLY